MFPLQGSDLTGISLSEERRGPAWLIGVCFDSSLAGKLNWAQRFHLEVSFSGAPFWLPGVLANSRLAYNADLGTRVLS